MTSVPDTSHRYLRQTPSERRVRTAASSSERISPHYHATLPPFPCLGKAIQSQSRVRLCNAVVRVRHQRPATPALAGQSNSFSLLRPHRSPFWDTPTPHIRTPPHNTPPVSLANNSRMLLTSLSPSSTPT